ncbi:MAG: metallophosphoesterase family protein [Phycisphaerales bacterium]|nr:metallophosphoesterase family protein [Phycisphaerales bacterium]
MPKIGLLSDSHGRAGTTRRAVSTLLVQGAEILIHLGDIGSMEVLDALLVEAPGQAARGQTLPAHLVFGNVDWDHASMTRYARHLGLHVDHPVGELVLDGKRLRFMHGDDPLAMSKALADQVDYLCHGHSHRMRDETQGSTRIINPVHFSGLQPTAWRCSTAAVGS